MEALVEVLFDLYKQITVVSVYINGTHKNHFRTRSGMTSPHYLGSLFPYYE